MLVEFAVSNFRSYRTEGKLSLVAAKTDDTLSNNCVAIPNEKFRLLRTAAIYGANASGKSNLILAMHQLANMLVPPNESHRSDFYEHTPFKLDPLCLRTPTKFSVAFVLGGVTYKYELSRSEEKIEYEALRVYPNGREQKWFEREGEEYFFSPHLKHDKVRLQKITPHSIPFLAVATSFAHPQLAPPARWINTNLSVRTIGIESMGRGKPVDHQIAQLIHTDAHFHRWVNAFLCHADVGIKRVEVAIESRIVRRVRRKSVGDNPPEAYVEELPEEIFLPQFVHSNVDGDPIIFDSGMESLGTRRLFRLLAPIYQVLKNGELAVFDEFSASMHPSMVKDLVALFQNPDSNPKDAQLVIALHDATLLNRGLFRRDQVWFVEKDSQGATDIYSLQDINGVRAEDSFEKGYLQGKYGAVPFFSTFDFPEVCDGEAERSWQQDSGPDSSESI